MMPVTAKAPTLAWLLTALTCLLVGMAIVESRHQVVALSVMPPVGVEVTVRVAFEPTATPEPTPRPTRTPTPDPMVPTPAPRPGGTGNVK
jgi:hypothetical protein